MTLKQRIRYLVDGLANGKWLRLSDIQERLLPASRNAVATNVTRMFHADQLRRRKAGQSYEYRPGSARVVVKPIGTVRKPPERLGFMALARLEKSDPAAYAKAVAIDRRRA